MALEVFADSPAGAVTSGGTDAPASGTSETFTVTVTVAFPVASASATPPTAFHVCDPAAPSEIMLVTANPGGTGTGQSWTVTRGADGTTPVTHATGYAIVQVVPAGWLNAVPWTYVGSGGGAPAFAADWANYGHGASNLGFRLLPDDTVEIIGLVTPSSGAGSTLFTLAAAYRPNSVQYLWGFNTAGAGCYWLVNTTGAVTLGGSALTDGDNYTINGRFSLSV